jgi:hypothetical protein
VEVLGIPRFFLAKILGMIDLLVLPSGIMAEAEILVTHYSLGTDLIVKSKPKIQP